MIKEKRILSYFIGWLIIGFCVLFVGVNNVFADTYYADDYTAQLYDNTNGNLTAVNTNKEESWSPGYYYGWIQLVANTSGGAWGISSPIPLIANHTYSMTVNTINIGCGYTILSSVNRIGVGTTLNNAKTSYQNNTNVNEKFSQAVNSSRYLQFVFTPTINSSYIVFPFASTSSCTTAEIHLDNVIIEDLGESGVSQDDINNSLNSQTNELNNSIQNSTDTITGEIDDMEQNIIDSNKETQDVIKDQFETCRPSKNLWPLSTSYTTTTGNEYVLRDTPITIKPGTYTISFKNSSNTKVLFNFKDSSGTSKEIYFENTYQQTVSFSNEQVLTAIYIYDRPSTISEIQFQSGTSATKFEEPGEEICTNRIDETNDKLDNLQGAITDSSAPNTNGLQNSAGWLPPGPLDSILNLPLTMLNSLTNSLGKTCSPLNLTLPYVNKNIQIPCLSAIFAQITGVNGLWTWVGTIASVLILYNYLLNLYAWVDRVLTLRAEFDEAMGADLANWGRL